MRESEDIAFKRQRCVAALAALQEALTTLERLPVHLTSQVLSSLSTHQEIHVSHTPTLATLKKHRFTDMSAENPFCTFG